ncbi:MAG: L-threonylcarbamoyladenylate synthase [Pseudomonadota bacterium]
MREDGGMSRSPSIVSGDTAISRGVDALAAGQLVGMPTETVYGLAADAANPAAVAQVFAAKSRPSFNPLIAHVASIALASEEGVLDKRAALLAGAFWPGPLTLVVPAGPGGRTCELARAGLSTIGLRMPAHPLAQALLSAHGGPLAAPSANPSGRLSPTRAEDVANAFGSEVSMVIDGGPCEAGIESSIVAALPDQPLRMLRPGAISRESLEAVAGPIEDDDGSNVTAPGQLASHYAPNAAIRLNAIDASDTEVLLGFGPDAPSGVLNLSYSGDVIEAAANLYRMLREADATGATAIAVMPVPDEGVGEAINDRLNRAAVPRGD